MTDRQEIQSVADARKLVDGLSNQALRWVVYAFKERMTGAQLVQALAWSSYEAELMVRAFEARYHDLLDLEEDAKYQGEEE